MTLTRLLSDRCHESSVTAPGDDIKPADKRWPTTISTPNLFSPPPGSGLAAIHSFEYHSPMHWYP